MTTKAQTGNRRAANRPGGNPAAGRANAAALAAGSPMLVGEIMTRDPIAVDRSTSTRELARILLDNEISGLPVVDERERVIGVVSRADLLLRFFEGPQASMPTTFLETLAEGLELDGEVDPEELGVVAEYMTPEPLTVAPDEPIDQVARLMAAERVHRVIVVDERNHMLGIVTTLDILRVFPRG